jgi:hypothetical protein
MKACGACLALATVLLCSPAFGQNREGPAPRPAASWPRTIAPSQETASAPTTIVVNPAAAERAGGVPQFQVDPFWPKPLPNNWILGQVAGVAVDKRNHIWMVHWTE